ncbi:nucleolar protein 4 [Kwoniella heveanensis BCC8398]|uniref:Nucleolar protein 4 n=1 Tax=Kwoniella heveanensis BCC8398 TaxID=1296120 RepID=A0A1B9GSI4_9TREE|nr:nucleolar protein 4 [Kwoniella heveanensis BCC8398]
MAEEDFIPLDADVSSSSKKEKKDRVNTTLFVSSLPYTATSTDLLTHFSYLGPVRHGFVATDKDTGKSKGVGYVTYSLREDAEQALKELNNGVFGGGNRRIRVSWADERAPLKDRKAERLEQSINPKKPRVAPGEERTSDPKAIRTLVLSGLPEGLTKNVLWKKVRKVNENAEVIYPVPAEEGEEQQQDIANIVFPSHGDALKALPKLHGHTYKGLILSCVLKKRLEKLSAKGEGKSPSHAGRLIIRNLAWDTTVQDLRAAFLPYGPIHTIDLPTLPSKLPPSADPSKPPPPPRARGFAFVWFLTKKDAEQAIEGVNGKVLKTKSGKNEREVAVDFALSKEKWEEAKKVDEPEQKEEGSESEASGSDDDDSESGSDSEEEGDDGDEDEEMSEAASDEDVDDVDAEDDEEEDEPVKPTLPSVDVGATLFIRNLPFETTEQELNQLFRSFGPLRYARITMDKVTGRSRGTGFVCFWNTEHADEAIVEAERVARETGANATAVTKNPFALPSVLTADPSSSLASRLVLHGRTLEVSRAVTREQAGQMKEDGERARNAGDKRNTYLMREGVIFPNSPAAASLPEAEVEKRQASFNARKTLLRSNPSLFISKTRLSIRQLPLFATDRTLKRLAIHAVRAFDTEVREGNREGLARIEEQDETLSAAIAARKNSGAGSKKGKERETVVIQSKIVRQTEKVDPLTGSGRSKGYGFLEMRSHKDALKVLRYANNNPEVGALMWTWWKDEMKELKERTERALVAARKREEGGAANSEAAKESQGKSEGKGKESVEELEARVKRLEQRLGEGDDRSQGGMRGGKTLLIEFSVENIQVVRRRVDKITTHRENARPDSRSGDSHNSRGRDGDRDRKRKADVIEAEDSEDEDPASGDKRSRSSGRGGAARGRGGPSGRGDSSSRGRGDGGRQPSRQGGQTHPRTGDRSQDRRQSADAGAALGGQGEKRGIEKMGNHLGSLIGRKRKMRKGK